MKYWSVTINMSQKLTGFNILSTGQIVEFVKSEREKSVEDEKTLSDESVFDVLARKPLRPIEPWIIQMVFKEFEEKYKDIKDVKLIAAEIRTLDR